MNVDVGNFVEAVLCIAWGALMGAYLFRPNIGTPDAEVERAWDEEGF